MKERVEGLTPYIKCQFHHVSSDRMEESKPFVTISRQTGAGGITIGRKLSSFLKEHDKHANCDCDWEVFDKNLVQKILKDHDYPEFLSEYMPEDKTSEIQHAINEIVGLYPSSLKLMRQTAETIARLACLGKVILVGRGANWLTRSIPGGIHVRLVGSLNRRTQHVQDYYGLSKRQAEDLIKTEDAGRKKYLKQHFEKDIDDPLLYDIVINTDKVSYDDAAMLIGREVMQRLKHPVSYSSK